MWKEPDGVPNIFDNNYKNSKVELQLKSIESFEITPFFLIKGNKCLFLKNF